MRLCLLSKAEDEASEMMKQTAKEAVIGNKPDYENMKSIARTFTTKRECSVQEAVCLVMPELWLSRIFPRVMFLKTNLTENVYKIFKKICKMTALIYFKEICLIGIWIVQVKVLRMAFIK